MSEDFILELSIFFARETLPILMGGDFNLIRSNRDRNKGQGYPKLMDLFNNFIGTFHLREIFISGVKFTWSNKQKNPTVVKLDRILVSASWDLNYSQSFAWFKARFGSDHSPLLLDTGEQGAPRPKYFFFEEKWIHHEGFLTYCTPNGGNLN
jgi:endonuclease/exonuclease/phosphatase family metal-dependent hydrolase